jgi:hypothetical protein
MKTLSGKWKGIVFSTLQHPSMLLTTCTWCWGPGLSLWVCSLQCVSIVACGQCECPWPQCQNLWNLSNRASHLANPMLDHLYKQLQEQCDKLYWDTLSTGLNANKTVERNKQTKHHVYRGCREEHLMQHGWCKLKSRTCDYQSFTNNYSWLRAVQICLNDLVWC